MEREAIWHELKTWPEEFEQIFLGIKHFEFRYNDRDFQVLDYLILREWNQLSKEYTGRCLTRVVTSIFRNKFSLPEGFVILSIEKA